MSKSSGQSGSSGGAVLCFISSGGCAVSSVFLLGAFSITISRFFAAISTNGFASFALGQGDAGQCIQTVVTGVPTRGAEGVLSRAATFGPGFPPTSSVFSVVV